MGSGNNLSSIIIADAIRLLEEALDAENNGAYEQAIFLYTDASKQLQEGVKYETDESEKQRYRYVLQTSDKRLNLLKNKKKKKSSSEGAPGERGAGKKLISILTNLLYNRVDSDEQKLSKDLDGAIVTESPNVRWDDVVGLDEAKKILKNASIIPFSQPQLYQGKLEPPKGVLLWGPNGTGKTYLAKAVATEAKCVFFSVSPAVIMSKWLGESEGRVKALFNKARKIPESKGVIVFIDEINSLFGNRSESTSSESRIIDEFFVQVDGLVSKHHGRVLVIGATNYPEKLDPGLHRRLPDQVYIPLPDLTARIKMLNIHLGEGHDLDEYDLKRVGEKLNGASGSDIKAFVNNVLSEPLNHAHNVKQFISVGDYYMPCEDYPNCALCTPKLSDDPPGKNYDCTMCNAKRMTIEEVPCNKLKLRDVRIDDFEEVLKRKPVVTVPASELERYEKHGRRWNDSISIVAKPAFV